MATKMATETDVGDAEEGEEDEKGEEDAGAEGKFRRGVGRKAGISTTADKVLFTGRIRPACRAFFAYNLPAGFSWGIVEMRARALSCE